MSHRRQCSETGRYFDDSRSRWRRVSRWWWWVSRWPVGDFLAQLLTDGQSVISWKPPMIVQPPPTAKYRAEHSRLWSECWRSHWQGQAADDGGAADGQNIELSIVRCGRKVGDRDD